MKLIFNNKSPHKCATIKLYYPHILKQEKSVKVEKMIVPCYMVDILEFEPLHSYLVRLYFRYAGGLKWSAAREMKECEMSFEAMREKKELDMLFEVILE